MGQNWVIIVRVGPKLGDLFKTLLFLIMITLSPVLAPVPGVRNPCPRCQFLASYERTGIDSNGTAFVSTAPHRTSGGTSVQITQWHTAQAKRKSWKRFNTLVTFILMMRRTRRIQSFLKGVGRHGWLSGGRTWAMLICWHLHSNFKRQNLGF
jgi:hypothetical protein